MPVEQVLGILSYLEEEVRGAIDLSGRMALVWKDTGCDGLYHYWSGQDDALLNVLRRLKVLMRDVSRL